MKQKHILLAHGVNLDLLGTRQVEIYGARTLGEMNEMIQEEFERLKNYFNLHNYLLEVFQSNDEAEYLEKLTEKPWSAIILNAGAWTHTSLALADRVAALPCHVIEVHLSQLWQRESFRHTGYLTQVSQQVIAGAGVQAYLAAVYACLAHCSQARDSLS